MLKNDKSDPRGKKFSLPTLWGRHQNLHFFPTKSDVLAKNIWTQIHNLTFTNFWTMILGPKI